MNSDFALEAEQDEKYHIEMILENAGLPNTPENFKSVSDFIRSQ